MQRKDVTLPQLSEAAETNDRLTNTSCTCTRKENKKPSSQREVEKRSSSQNPLASRPTCCRTLRAVQTEVRVVLQLVKSYKELLSY